MGIIYCCTNKINGKQYVGLTIKTLEERKTQHYNWAFNNRDNFHFHRALRKWGRKNFKWEILEKTDNLNEKEVYYISKHDTYNNGYNMTIGGEGTTGWTHSAETRTRMSEARKGEKHPNYGKPMSEEQKAKLSESHKGKTISDETKQKLSKANKGENNPMYGRTSEQAPMYGVTPTNAKLTKQQAIQIKYHEVGTQKEIAEKYGIARQQVSAIKKSKTWKHI